MLNLLLPMLEEQMRVETRENVNKIRSVQTQNKVRWFAIGSSAMCCFGVALLCAMLADRVSRPMAVVSVSLLASCFILLIERALRNDSDRLASIASSATTTIENVRTRLRLDFLRIPLYLCLLCVYVPVLAAIWLVVAGRHDWIVISDPMSPKATDLFKQLATLAAALLTAQIAIFNFLFGQILGKFSSSVAVAVSQHKVIRMLRNCSMFLLAALYLGVFYGGPSNYRTAATWIIVALIASFSLTIYISHAGIQIDRAILYSGEHVSRSLHRYAKKPITKVTKFWKVLGNLGLDWRSPERLGGGFVPHKLATRADSAISGLFNAAHKSIQENQQETLVASLRALARIVIAYSTERKKYAGEGDAGIGYINDQFSGLLLAAQGSKNEYLISNVVMFTGACARAVIRIGWKEEESQAEKRSSAHFSNWVALLSEAYKLGADLKRSTAASEAIKQLYELAINALVLRYYDDVNYSYLPEVNRIFFDSFSRATPYHLRLAAEALQGVLNVWNLCRDETRMFHLSASLGKQITEMGVITASIEKIPFTALKGPVDILTTKLSQQPTLQDIAAIHCTLNPDSMWKVAELNKSFDGVKRAICAPTEAAMKVDSISANHFSQAFYEIALLVALRDKVKVADPRPAEYDLREAWLLSLTKKLDYLIIRSLESKKGRSELTAHFSNVLGILLVIAKETDSSLLKERCIRIIRRVTVEVVKKSRRGDRASEFSLSYLQLYGAWSQLLDQPQFTRRIAAIVSARRVIERDRFSFGRGEIWGREGYPESGDLLGGDYALTVPRNIQEILKNPGRAVLINWNNVLMGADLLKRFVDMSSRKKNKEKSPSHTG